MTTLKQNHAAPRTSKTDSVREQLKAMALNAGPGAKLPTVRQLRKTLGAANTTLSDALWDLEASGVVNRKQGSGLYVSDRIAHKNIAMVFGNNVFAPGVSPFYGQLIQRCEQRAKSHRENFSFYLDMQTSQDDAAGGGYPVHRDLAMAIEAGKLHGILLASRNSHAEEEWLRSQKLPLVSLNTYRSWPTTVVLDYQALVELGVEALAQQRCRRIALMLPVPMPDASSLTVWNANVRAYTLAMEQHNLPHRTQWVWQKTWQDGDAQKTREAFGAQAFRELFAPGQSKAPDAVVIIDDMMTRGAIRAARQMGIVVGRDVKIASHANKGSPALEEYAQDLELIEFDPAQMVQAMFGMLEQLMNGTKVSKEFTTVKPQRKPKEAQKNQELQP